MKKKNKAKIGWSLHHGDFQLHFNGKYYDKAIIADAVFIADL